MLVHRCNVLFWISLSCSTSSSVCGVSIDATIAELHLRYHPDGKILEVNLFQCNYSMGTWSGSLEHDFRTSGGARNRNIMVG